MAEILDTMGAWTAVPNRVLLDSRLSKSALRLYMIFLSHARPSEGKMKVWPGVSKLAEESGFSPSTVKRSIKELTESVEGHRGPLIQREKRLGPTSITYILHPLFAYLFDPSLDHERPHQEPPSDPIEEDVVEEDKSCAASSTTNVTITKHPFDDEEQLENGWPARKKPQNQHNELEFREQAERFRVRYNEAARVAGWSPCDVMTPARRRSLFLRKEKVLSSSALEALWAGIEGKGEDGFKSSLSWLLRSDENCLQVIERGRRA